MLFECMQLMLHSRRNQGANLSLHVYLRRYYTMPVVRRALTALVCLGSYCGLHKMHIRTEGGVADHLASVGGQMRRPRTPKTKAAKVLSFPRDTEQWVNRRPNNEAAEGSIC